MNAKTLLLALLGIGALYLAFTHWGVGRTPADPLVTHLRSEAEALRALGEQVRDTHRIP